jgi:hypothetical protein
MERSFQDDMEIRAESTARICVHVGLVDGCPAHDPGTGGTPGGTPAVPGSLNLRWGRTRPR